ncbi:MAG TPA: TldD/PmbA family protein [Acidobacteriota bacterium]|nr:TldD/PmbA family protein [Acidobacteriota bacterium]
MADLVQIEKAGAFVANEGRRVADYADFRSVRITSESIDLSGGAIDKVDRTVSFGFAVRVLVRGAWGFAAFPDCDLASAEAALNEAAAIARASAKLMAEPVVLAPVVVVKDEYQTPVQIDPFAKPLKEKIDYLTSLDALLRQTEGINRSTTSMSFRREEKWFYSTEGSVITQTIVHSGGGFTVGSMKSRREMSERSYPTSGGQHKAGGYEIIEAMKLDDACEEMAQQALALLTAPPLPEQTTDLILSSDLLSLQIHESIGHPLELDRVFGAERNFSGTSFATPDKRGTLKYGSDIVTVTTDPTATGGLGTYGYDDEGVPAQRVAMIDKGVLVNYLSSRETAARLGLESTGAMRAESWADLPLVRMTNTNLAPGSGTLEELIADTERGVLIQTPASWTIDDKRENFQLGGEIAWEIVNGKRGQIYSAGVYSGNTVEFWNSCDRICGAEEWKLWGTPNCGKGQPGQNMRTAQGTAPARFREINVGQPA